MCFVVLFFKYDVSVYAVAVIYLAINSFNSFTRELPVAVHADS